jgi:outer membrane protein
MTARRPALAALSFAASALLAGAPAAAQTAAPPVPADRLVGELGLGLYARTEVVRDTGTSTMLLPYVYADWGRFFARVDTLGAKIVPLGLGHLELVARISTEGWDADRPSLRGLSDRDNPLPVGIGTMQRTAYGALFLYAMHDLRSGGNYLEATWGSRFDLGRVALYPLLGLEHRTGGYVRHLYGVSVAESAASGQAAYSPGASTVPMVGLAATVPISGPWAVQLQWRHRWLDDAIRRSPIVATGSLDSGHVALTYEFK